MTSDSLALLSRDSVVLMVGDVRVVVPYAPAGTWMAHLDRMHLMVYLMAEPECQRALRDALIEVPGAETALQEQSFQLIRHLTGRRWWEAVRLLRLAASPDVLGRLVVAGVDPWQRTLGEWCAAMYTLATQNADEKERIKFEMQLSFPPAGFEDEWDDGAEDFQAIAAAMRNMPGVPDGKA